MPEDLTKRIDDDWKRRAQLEKEQLSVKAKGDGPSASPGAGGAKAAEGVKPSQAFLTLLNQLANQAAYYLGLVDDPVQGRAPVDLEAARATIEMIDALDQRTRGNLAKEEAQALKDVLADLRVAYVETTQRKR